MLAIPLPPFSQAYPMQLPLFTGFESMLEIAKEQTATVPIESLERTPDRLNGVVAVHSLTGHYLPSGFGFRGMFIEVLVLDGQGEVLWLSVARTNFVSFLMVSVMMYWRASSRRASPRQRCSPATR